MRWQRFVLALTAFLATLFTQTASAQVQSEVVLISDHSDPQSPLSVSGQVVFQYEIEGNVLQNKYQIEGKLLNKSDKPIIAYEVTVSGTPSNGVGFNFVKMIDHFFRPALTFTSGTSESLNYTDPSFTKTAADGITPTTAQAQVKVIFVEFADGTRFGKSHWGDSIATSREKAAAMLQTIAAAHDASGGAGMREALDTALLPENSSDELTTRGMLDSLITKMKVEGPDAARQQINDFLNTGRERKNIQ